MLFRHTVGRAGRVLSDFLSTAPDCTECELLLRLIEHCKPDWIHEQRFGNMLIKVVYNYNEGPTTIALFEQEGLEEPVDKFQLLRHSSGMIFLR
jgi:hypothetical protein